ncbi:hypothetical protein HY637_04230 [Candidatus Woesearchaeota archaeon]|nr:hypothetical protein [Candidatus Woesearchaeota archaeon]
MKSKKSQVAYFMLVGLVLIIITSFLLYLMSFAQTNTNQVISNDLLPFEVQPFVYKFEKCIELTTFEAINEIGLNGGYLKFEKPYFSAESFKANYAAYNRTITLPSLNTIEFYLSEYIKTNMPKCLDFTQFPEFKFKDNGMQVNSAIDKYFITIKIDWDLNLIKEYQNVKSSYRVPEISKQFSASFLNIYTIAESIAIKSILDPDYVDVVFLLGQFTNITYSIYNNETAVYLITDNNVVKNSQYQFIFATKNPV